MIMATNLQLQFHQKNNNDLQQQDLICGSEGEKEHRRASLWA
jgi:hypothetical protein